MEEPEFLLKLTNCDVLLSLQPRPSCSWSISSTRRPVSSSSAAWSADLAWVRVRVSWVRVRFRFVIRSPGVGRCAVQSPHRLRPSSSPGYISLSPRGWPLPWLLHVAISSWMPGGIGRKGDKGAKECSGVFTFKKNVFNSVFV